VASARSLKFFPVFEFDLLSFQGSALERTAFEAPPRDRCAIPTQEAGASGALRPQAEPGDECCSGASGALRPQAEPGDECCRSLRCIASPGGARGRVLNEMVLVLETR